MDLAASRSTVKMTPIILLLSLQILNVIAEETSYKPFYHLYPIVGWMNDPCGFSYFQGKYHLFYQHNPYSTSDPGTAHWRQATSTDLIYWTDEGIALYPDEPYDINGVFTGGAIVVNNTLYLFYTGNVKNGSTTIQRQALAYTEDGNSFTKYPDNPIIEGSEFQPDFRDPQVWKHEDTYYMVVGNSYMNGTRGRVLLFSSQDLVIWKYETVLDQSDGTFGYMWECPSFFKLGEIYILLVSPQGVKPQGDMYKNLYQTVYIPGTFDYNTKKFKRLREPREVDHGTHFYATQIITINGTVIMIAWNDMWNQTLPENDQGFHGTTTTPRTLTLTSNYDLLQNPIKELNKARGQVIYSGKLKGNAKITLKNNAAQILIVAPQKNIDIYFESDDPSRTVTVSYRYSIFGDSRISVDKGGEDGFRRTTWNFKGKLRLNILIDRSNFEMFCGQGERAFSDRIFPVGNLTLRLGKQSKVENIKVYELKRTVYLD